MRGLAKSLLLAAAVWACPIAGAAAPDWADAINQAGRQRMLTQRITANYIQAGIGANAELARTRLLDAIEQFERQHAYLSGLELPADIHQMLDTLGRDWIAFRALAGGVPERERVAELTALDTRLLEACERVVSRLEAAAGGPQGRLVNLSGRQRMLTQRIARNYLLLAAGLGGPDTPERIRTDRDEFRVVLNTLLSERNYSATIGVRLDEVAAQWVWVESALDMTDDIRYPLIVSDACEKILGLLESLTRMYATVENG